MNSIGIIVPVYNVKEKYLRECIDSLLAQTYKNIRIYIIDDKSLEWCSNICDRIGKTDNRITVIHHKENKGVSEARNTALRRVSEDWICFVDGDDWVDADMCERFITYLSKGSNPDVYMFSGYRSYPNHEEGNNSGFPIKEYKGPSDMEKLQIASLTTFLIGNPENIVPYDSPWGKFYSTKLIKENDIYFKPIPFREDALFFQEVLQNANYIIEVSDLLYHYRMSNGSAVNVYRKNMKEEIEQYLSLLWDFAENNDKGQIYNQALYGAGFFAMQSIITNYFYNPQCELTHKQRRKECKAFFTQKYFDGVFREFPLKRIKRNHRIKMIMLRLKMYNGIQIFRQIYLFVHKRSCFD